MFGKVAAQCVQQLGALTERAGRGCERSIARACCAALFTATVRMVGRGPPRQSLPRPPRRSSAAYEGAHVDGRDEPDCHGRAGRVHGPSGARSRKPPSPRPQAAAHHEFRPNCGPRQFLAKNCASVRRSAMNLEDLRCQVDADDANLIHGCLLSPSMVTSGITILAHRDAVGRGHPPHQKGGSDADLVLSLASSTRYILAFFQGGYR